MTEPANIDGSGGDDVPPIGEEVHLPGPTLIPVVNALGITLALVGIILTPLLSVVGVVIFVWSTLRWIGDTRRDISELPLEHR